MNSIRGESRESGSYIRVIPNEECTLAQGGMEIEAG